MRTLCSLGALLGLALVPSLAGALPACEFDFQPPAPQNLGDRGCFIEIGPNEGLAPHFLTIVVDPEVDDYLVNFILDIGELRTRDSDAWFNVFELETFDAAHDIDRIFRVEANRHQEGHPRIRLRHLAAHDSGTHFEVVQETALDALEACTRILGHWERSGARAVRPVLRWEVATVRDCASPTESFRIKEVMQTSNVGEPVRLSLGRLGVTGEVDAAEQGKGYLNLFDPFDW